MPQKQTQTSTKGKKGKGVHKHKASTAAWNKRARADKAKRRSIKNMQKLKSGFANSTTRRHRPAA